MTIEAGVEKGATASPSDAPPPSRKRRGSVVPSVLDGGRSAGGWTPEPSVWHRLRQEPESQTVIRILGPAVVILGFQVVLFPMSLGNYLYGLILGGLAALVAVGMALVYRANRIINFSQGHLGLVPATIAVGLWKFTDLWMPFAFAVGLGLAVMLGAGLDMVVIRRFSQAPRLVLTVATIGLAQLLGVTSIGLPYLWGETPVDLAQQTLDVPVDVRFELDSILFPTERIAALVMAPLCLLAIAVFLRRTPAGIAVRAAAERRDRAALLGIPVARLGTLIWVITTVLSFVAVFIGALVHNGLGINDPTLGFGTALAALAALMMGRLYDLPSIAASAVALSVLQLGVTLNHGDSPDLEWVVLALVVAGALAIRRIDRLRAGQDEISSWKAAEEVRPVPRQLRQLPEIRLSRRVGLVAVLGVALLLPAVLPTSDNLKTTSIVAFAIVGLSVVVLAGWAGQISLGQMAFAGYGGVFGAIGFRNLGWDVMLVLPLAGLVGAGIAVVVGLPALRLRGIFLAAITLAFAVASGYYVLSPRHLGWIPRSRIEEVTLFQVITIQSRADIYYLTLGVAVLLFAAVAGIRRSRTGRVLMALRENELAAQSHGVAATRAKLTGFALSGGLAAVAGCLYMLANRGYDEALFAPTESMVVFTATVVGGMGSMLGGVIGALFLRGGAWFLTGNWVYVPSAVGVLVVLWLFPSGISGLLYRGRDAALRNIARRRGIDVPALEGSGGAPLAPNKDARDDARARPQMDVGRADSTPPPDPDAVLDVRGIDVAYGDVQVLFDVDLSVRAGEVVALLGTNGAGKSTLLKAVSGLLTPSRGSITLDGRSLVGEAPHHVAARGVAQMPGGHAVFPSLTVDENLRMACWLEKSGTRNGANGGNGNGDGVFGSAPRSAGIPIPGTDVVLPPIDAPLDERMEAALEVFPLLRWRMDDQAADLSGGQQQMLSLAMALLAQPRVLLIDELSLGLAPVVVAQLLDVVRAIAAQGTAIVLVEQSVNVALTLAERAVFMEKGEVRFSGPSADLLERPDLLRSVFLEGASSGLATGAAGIPGTGGAGATPGIGGSDLAVSADWTALPKAAVAAPAFELRGVTVSFGGIRAVDDVSLVVEPGEILGVIGPNGAGKTTLFDVISGVTPADRGLVLLDGVDVAPMHADDRARHGIGRSFQDAMLYPSLTVEEALAVAFDRWLPTKNPLLAAVRSPEQRATEAEVRERVDELIGLLGLEQFRDKFISELSTGSRRIVDLGCILAHHPSVVLLDEPSSGIAQREAEALGPLLRRVRDVLGASVLLVEHDMSLVAGLADRLVAMDQGQVIAEGPVDQVLRDPAVVTSYLGGSKAAIQRSGPAADQVAVTAPAAVEAGPGAGGGRPPLGPRHRRTGYGGHDEGDGEGGGTDTGHSGDGGDGGHGGHGAPASRDQRARHRRRHKHRLRTYAMPIGSVMAVLSFAVVGGLGRTPGDSAVEPPPPAERAGVADPVQVPPIYEEASDSERRSTDWVANCDRETGRIMMPSIFAPPCVPAFRGSNGGETWPGVTEDTIRIAQYVPQGGDLLQIFTQSLDDENEMRATRDQYVAMFNEVFETYGRRVELVEFDATGAMDDVVAARADAERLAEEVEPFIVLGGPPLTTAFAEELANRGIICVGCGLATPDSFHQEMAPFLWDPLPTPEEFLLTVGNYIFNRLQGRNAEFAGDEDMRRSERRFGIVHFDQRNPVFDQLADLSRTVAEANDLEYAAEETYVFDLDEMQERAATIISQMKSAGVTTIVFLGDPVMPIYLTQQATEQDYFPEWVVTGTVLTDTTAVGRYYDQQQWAHAFGLSVLPVQTDLAMGEGYRLHEWYSGQPPAAEKTSQIIYQGIFHAFLGIHMAGPDLRPDSFRDGLFHYPPTGGGPTNPRVSFGNNRLFMSLRLTTLIDYLGVDDMVEIWWDPQARGPDETGREGTGMWTYANDGRRYLPGDMEAGPPDAFRREGSVQRFTDYPEEDRPPQYPSPGAPTYPRS